MSFRLQQIPADGKFGQQVRVDILERWYPREVVSYGFCWGEWATQASTPSEPCRFHEEVSCGDV